MSDSIEIDPEEQYDPEDHHGLATSLVYFDSRYYMSTYPVFAKDPIPFTRSRRQIADQTHGWDLFDTKRYEKIDSDLTTQIQKGMASVIKRTVYQTVWASEIAMVEVMYRYDKSFVIRKFGVSYEYHRLGIATALLDYLERIVKEHGIKRVFIESVVTLSMKKMIETKEGYVCVHENCYEKQIN